MPLEIVRYDITKMKVDAIVNAADPSLLGGGGVDGAIHRAAGIGLLAECRRLGGCRTGEAKITGGYNLPAKHVIHTVGPIYRDGKHNEEALLESCYRESLRLAAENGCSSVAFPLISAGAFRYPKREAFRVAARTIRALLEEYEITVYLVIYDRSIPVLADEVRSDISEYIEENYEDGYPRFYSASICMRGSAPVQHRIGRKKEANEYIEDGLADDLGGRLKRLDESFSEMLLRLIDEREIGDVECYKRANIDRKLFSKIRSDRAYRPSKQTVLAFAIALRLTLSETEAMLKTAGFALSHSNKFDIIIEYFINKEIYDVFKINEALFAFDQSLLGG